VLWRRKSLLKDECITAWVALKMIEKHINSDQEPILTSSDVVGFGLDYYGIRIPEEIAKSTLNKLVGLGILKKNREKYMLTDVALTVIKLAYCYASKNVNEPNKSKIEELKQNTVLMPALMTFSRHKLEKIATTLKSVSMCGRKALKELFEQVQPQLQ